MPYTQDRARIAVDTPLGKDVLLLTEFTGREAISQLFRFTLDMMSEKQDLAPADLIGKSVTWLVRDTNTGKPARYFNAIVTRFTAGDRLIRGLRLYRAEVVPWLWFLTRTSNCRIFQNKSAVEIIEQVFKALGFSAYEKSLGGQHAKRDYCVQYRETDFHFVSRLMEQEGIFYFFRHANGKHTLVLADQKSAYLPLPDSKAEYTLGNVPYAHITHWEHQYEFRSGQWALTDYNFETPTTDLSAKTPTVVKLTDNKKYELYDYPGLYLQKNAGNDLTRIRMEEEETAYDGVSGAGTFPTFTPGAKFTLLAHPCATEAGVDYVLTAVEHGANETSYMTGGPPPEPYKNTFTCIPAAVLFRPPRVTPRSVVQGPQTAVVVGPKDQEIYTDKYGRVKVQFFWDRDGKKDENSSCWIRVAQNWGGNNWGIVFHPRVGQEVVVDFLEGDPDRPIITGRVYNAQQMPPYELPKNQTQSTIKSRSSAKGEASNFNELRFEDKKGSEQVFLHSEKDMDWRVKNDSREFVGNDRHLIVKGNQTESVDKDRQEHVKGGQVTLVDKDRQEHVKGKQVEKIDGDVQVQVGGKHQEKVTGDYALQAANIFLKAGTNLVLQAGTQVSLVVGGNFITIDASGVAINGKLVQINSGGSAGSGTDPSPGTPADPKDPDVADDGTKVGKLN